VDKITCCCCGDAFDSYLNLARHMILKDRPAGNRPAGEHILLLEEILGEPYESFGWGSDKRIAVALRQYYSKPGLVA
jgi:hypothetical protein